MSSIATSVVNSSNSHNSTQSPLVGIVPLTRAAIKNPVHLRLEAHDSGLESPSTALTDHARFIDRTRLKGEAIGQVKQVPMALLDRQLARVLGL